MREGRGGAGWGEASDHYYIRPPIRNISEPATSSKYGPPPRIDKAQSQSELRYLYTAWLMKVSLRYKYTYYGVVVCAYLCEPDEWRGSKWSAVTGVTKIY